LRQNGGQVKFCALKVSLVKLNFGHAEKSLIVFSVVVQCLFVVLKSLLEVLCSVLHLPQDETEVAFKMFNLLPEFNKVCFFGPSLQLQDLLSS